MEVINAGWLSILPPIIAITLALITKEVISSLVIGILSGSIIYAALTPTTNFLGSVMDGTLFALTNRFSIPIIIFLGMLGSLVYVITKAGGSRAYGEWASKKIKSKAGAQLSTFFLGILIFIDDYFNCLTVGTVMKPVTDKYKVSRVKLAYIIDATAAPICIIAPISSWAASVMVYMEGSGMNGMQAFIRSIPYNLYAMLTIVMVLVLCFTNLEFGPMARHEKLAREKGDLSISKTAKEMSDEEILAKGKVRDLVLPILSLVIFSVMAMLYVGGYFGSDMTLFEAFGNTDAAVAITYGAIGALIFTFLLYVPRKLMCFREFMEGIGKGVGTMNQAFIILTLAWAMSTVCRDMLGTGIYVGELVKASNMVGAFIPVIIFIVAAFLSFSMGTSWGTFGILIPIIIDICASIAPELMIISLSATLAGSVFGDHCSPISDTTILSSTGAGCDHIDHVSTQMYYSGVVAICCLVGYLIAGFTKNIFLTLGVSIAMLLIILKVLHTVTIKKANSR